MTRNEANLIREYISYFESFFRNEHSAEEFSIIYMDKFKKNEVMYSSETYEVINEFFSDCDCLTFNENLIKENPILNIGEQEFREKALLTQKRLVALLLSA
jgi:predicted glycosyltransferase involved in capsule biosynthesis